VHKPIVSHSDRVMSDADEQADVARLKDRNERLIELIVRRNSDALAAPLPASRHAA